MGFFSKNKLTIDQLAEDLANEVLESISEASLQQYTTMLRVRDVGESEEFDDRQKRELLILKMLAITRAVQNVFTNSDDEKSLLDKLYAKIYNKISGSKEDQISFEQFINERYQTYYKILASKEDNMPFQFGKQFVNYFFNKDIMSSDSRGEYLPFIMFIAKIFTINLKNDSDFFKEILSKYELKK